MLIEVPAKYCSNHEYSRSENNKAYDKYKRNATSKVFYNSTAWKNKRAQILIRDLGIDVYIYITEGRAVPASHVHHIIEYRDDVNKALDDNNLISLSDKSHSKISKLYLNEKNKKDIQIKLRECLDKFEKLKSGIEIDEQNKFNK